MGVRLLTVCGSLRARSANAELLRAATLVAPEGVEVASFGGLAALPHFNPDEEGAGHPAVLAWQAELAGSGGVLIASPEYAHGIPGSLKNALDCVVGSGELVGKPVALLNASPRATHAQAQLREVLRTMDARVVVELTLPVAGRGRDAGAIAADPALAGPLRDAVLAVATASESARAGELAPED